MSRRARWWWLLTPLLLVGGCFAWLSNYGVDVVVANVGAVPLTDVRVRVTGNEYDLGTLSPGTRRKVRVEAKTDSHVELDWKTPDQRTHDAVVDCYFGGGPWTGTVRAEIDGAVMVRSEDNIRIWLGFVSPACRRNPSR